MSYYIEGVYYWIAICRDENTPTEILDGLSNTEYSVFVEYNPSTPNYLKKYLRYSSL
jgi:hypothetical protein